MSFPTTAARLSFFGMGEDAPAANTTRARVDAAVSCSSPAAPLFEKSFPIGKHGQYVVQALPANDFAPARLVIRRWTATHTGKWEPVHNEPGICIFASRAEAFARAVVAAGAALEGEPRP
jgi:hypothetical protein